MSPSADLPLHGSTLHLGGRTSGFLGGMFSTNWSDCTAGIDRGARRVTDTDDAALLGADSKSASLASEALLCLALQGATSSVCSRLAITSHPQSETPSSIGNTGAPGVQLLDLACDAVRLVACPEPGHRRTRRSCSSPPRLARSGPTAIERTATASHLRPVQSRRRSTHEQDQSTHPLLHHLRGTRSRGDHHPKLHLQQPRSGPQDVSRSPPGPRRSVDAHCDEKLRLVIALGEASPLDCRPDRG